MSHADAPSMLAFWAIVAIGGFGALCLLWAFGSIYWETFKEEL